MCALSNDTASAKSAQYQQARRVSGAHQTVSALCVHRCANRDDSANRADAVFKDPDPHTNRVRRRLTESYKMRKFDAKDLPF